MSLIWPAVSLVVGGILASVQCYQEWMIFFMFLLNCEGFTQSTFLDDFLGQYTWTFDYAPKCSPLFHFFASSQFFNKCKENGNFIRKKTSTGSKIWTYSFFWSKYQTKKESQCQRCYCLGQHTNTLYNFRHKSTNITWFFGVFGTILSKWWNSLLLGSELWHHCGWVTILVGYIVPQHG